jgi:hypothetical protein
MAFDVCGFFIGRLKTFPAFLIAVRLSRGVALQERDDERRRRTARSETSV